jgi:hypothetical protein
MLGIGWVLNIWYFITTNKNGYSKDDTRMEALWAEKSFTYCWYTRND